MKGECSNFNKMKQLENGKEYILKDVYIRDAGSFGVKIYIIYFFFFFCLRFLVTLCDLVSITFKINIVKRKN